MQAAYGLYVLAALLVIALVAFLARKSSALLKIYRVASLTGLGISLLFIAKFWTHSSDVDGCNYFTHESGEAYSIIAACVFGALALALYALPAIYNKDRISPKAKAIILALTTVGIACAAIAIWWTTSFRLFWCF